VSILGGGSLEAGNVLGLGKILYRNRRLIKGYEQMMETSETIIKIRVDALSVNRTKLSAASKICRESKLGVSANSWHGAL
jgi:hypothetical protein